MLVVAVAGDGVRRHRPLDARQGIPVPERGVGAPVAAGEPSRAHAACGHADAEPGAVAIVPAGAPAAGDLRTVPLRGGVALPLHAVRRPGRPARAVALMRTAPAPDAG